MAGTSGSAFKVGVWIKTLFSALRIADSHAAFWGFDTDLWLGGPYGCRLTMAMGKGSWAGCAM